MSHVLLPLIPYLALIALFLGASIGCISAYSNVRKWSLLGDILSHASLPGIVYMLLLTHTKNITFLILGGVVSALISAFISFYLNKNNIFAKDAPFAVVLAWFFSIGIIGISIIQKQSIEGQSLINNFIFGNILMCSNKTFLYYIPFLLFTTLFFFITHRVQQLLAFDYEYGSLRYRKLMKIYDSIYLLLTIITIVVGLQALGILLMGSLVIAPGVFGRLLSSSYRYVMILSCIGCIICFSLGIFLSLNFTFIPTGPLIALSAISIVLCSIIYYFFKNGDS